MAGTSYSFGLTTLVTIDGRIIRKGRGSQWTANMKINRFKESKWLMSGQESFHDFLKRVNLYYPITPIEITSFVSNNRQIFIGDREDKITGFGEEDSISTIYPGRRSATTLFVRMKDRRTETSSLWLLTVGSKSLQELKLIGLDTQRQSKIPLLVDNELRPINLF